MSEDDRSPTMPEDHAEELSYLLANAPGTSDVTWSADDDGAIVTCYAHRDHVDDVERLADESRFDQVHKHEVGDEVHYLFGYSSES